MEKRKKERYPANEAIGVTFSIHGLKQEFDGILNDKSGHGIGITSSEIIPPETMLDISISDPASDDLGTEQHFLGEVCWCESSDLIPDTYLMGIKSHEARSIM